MCAGPGVSPHRRGIRGFSPARPTAHWGSGVWAVFWIFHFQRLYSPHPVRSSAQKTIPTGSDAGRRLGSVVARCPTRHSDSGSGLDGAEVTLVCRKASLSTSGGRKVLVRGRISSHAKTTNLGSRVIPAQPLCPLITVPLVFLCYIVRCCSHSGDGRR